MKYNIVFIFLNKKIIQVKLIFKLQLIVKLTFETFDTRINCVKDEPGSITFDDGGNICNWKV